MGSNQSINSKAILNNTNNLYENSSAACISTCTAITTSPTITISNTKVGGNINITTKCSASASCVMQSQLSAQVENIMSSISKQQNITTQLLPIAFDFNNKNSSTEIKQNITNNITQTIQSVCQATDTTLTTNPTVVGSNATIGGDINIINEGSSNADCAINNLARMSLFNQSTSNDNQTTKQSNVLGVMMIAIVIIIVIGIVMVIIVIGPAGLAAVVGMKSSGNTSTDGASGENGELDKLLNGGSGEGSGEGLMSEAGELAEFA